MLDTPNVSGGRSISSRPAGRAEVVEATLSAAAELFAEHNPSQVSVRDIAARAGVSHALVHRYLGSKEDILGAVLVRGRQEAADYWIDVHGHGRPERAFAPELPPGRFIRTVMRASMDGYELEPDDVRLPDAERMLEFLKTRGFPAVENAPGFDVRLLFAATTAMAAGMAVAEDFFLIQAGLENENREEIAAQTSRLVMHIMTLADRSNTDAED